MHEKERDNVIVLGVGNVLLGDEGVGVKVVEELGKLDMPENVELVDGATLGLDLLPVIERADRLIIIDVVKAGTEPGTIFKFSPRDLEVPREPGRMSLHQVSLVEVLAMAEMLSGRAPHTTIFGVEPKEIDWGREISPEISEKIPALIELIVDEIAGPQAAQ